ncbi:NADP-dependent oxidoreductase [Nocardioides sp. InS609-2]|uniref:quinone oxidoreductase family protein n=1 Tax=Nocardioides sp. InS609-2 TaxID=2760705 RepID=UPI0020BF9637|nr:NADP-dependent oxidoreductase [Nocardioides sp. InS609-2]
MSTVVVAAAYGGPEHLEVREVDVAAPGPGEVTLEVRAAGINPIDVKSYSGMMSTDESELPKRLGLEVAGVVTAVGDDAVGPSGPIAVGDEVVGYRVTGGYAATLNAPASSVFPKPPSLSWEQAAGMSLTGVTAYHLLEATGVSEGDVVLVHGVAGGVGLSAAQLALGRGATVIGTAAEHRHETLRGYGIVPVVYGAGLADRVRTAAPDGVDVALDTIGTDEAVDVSIELAPLDRIATVAAFGRGDTGIKLLGGGPGADPGTEIREGARLVIAELAGRGELDVVVSRTFPLAEAADAHRFVIEGHAGGKVVLLP